ncbi:MAG: O-antigen ligase family protein [Candidatus Peregrinibacteria bacterium]|nr:O-antigen ligase family protein [Candidatus Peregrinibacteria bacterium]
MLSRSIKYLWPALLFTLPFSRHLILFESLSYRFGQFNPWVTGFLFLPEALLILIFTLNLFQKDGRKALQKFLRPSLGLLFFIAFLLNALAVSYFAGQFTLFAFFALRMMELGMLVFLLHREIIPLRTTIHWLLYGAVFQLVLGYVQVRLNHSLGLAFLGEPAIGPDILNVAKTDLPDGAKQIRPYGTFLHPNIFGAYLLALLFLSLPYLKKAALPFWLIILTAGIYLSASQAAQLTAILTFGILILLTFLKTVSYKKWLSLSLLAILLAGNGALFFRGSALNSEAPSITQRLELTDISRSMFSTQPWGVGTFNFTLEMENFADRKLNPWEIQPVHNVYFLVLNETGLQGLLLLLVTIVYLFYQFFHEDHFFNFRRKLRILPLFALMIIASFDHLFWTSYIGTFLVALVIAETIRKT